jgi:RNA-directed DNA polymerase
MTTELTRFTRWAAEKPQERYTSLMGMLADVQGLAESFARQKARKAPGVDGVRKADYGQQLEVKLTDLSGRLRRMAYRPKPARRVYIPKGDGKGKRALGLPSFEDRIVEHRASGIVQAIWEPQFRECSHGFRSGRSCHTALSRLNHILSVQRTQWLVEADIRNFFGSVVIEHLARFLAHRIGDKNLLRLIRRFLKAGVLEDGAFQATEQGTPQGNLLSPVLSNIYLHYVLDVWFERRFARRDCRGKAFLVRYADDFVACFELEEDARAFELALKGRLADFGLEVEPTKTALMRFGTLAPIQCRAEGERKPRSFSFLGFLHYWEVSRRTGKATLARKTQGSRMNKKLTALKQRLRSMLTEGKRAMQEYVLAHVRGHIQYYGIRGNLRSVSVYIYQVERKLFWALNRRGQRRSFNWAQFCRWKRTWMPHPRAAHAL